ncbi:MAG: ABC transporter permease [Gemmatimonadaceae bacterium]
MSSRPASTPVDARDTQTIIIDGSAHWKRWWADLYLYRGALRSLAWRNVRSRYKQAALGMTWAVVQPAVQVGVFTVLFGTLAKVPSGDVPYPLLALAGLLPWNAFSKIVSEGAVSLVSNQHLITKLFFPRVYLVLAAGASALLDALVTLGLLVVFMVAFGREPGVGVVLAVPAFLGVVLLSYGLAALLAAVNARWRDVQHTIPFVLQVGLFVTPVLYRETLVPERWRWLVALNPLTGLIEVFRAAVLDIPLPAPRVLATSLAASAVVVVLGFWWFTRSEASIVDVV